MIAVLSDYYSRSLQLGAAIAIGSAILGMRFQVNSAWLVLGGAAIGWLAFHWDIQFSLLLWLIAIEICIIQTLKYTPNPHPAGK
ncbi:hypothetical protein [Chamaesiphon sp. OTE_8_metabat_110]|uniref:hypothetical protein n=1 Tax=Chamaesiphon sp. OTE_8_metabat_110 TaxID=2964696 RepID=UPI00286D05BF|nr:hypothetical protein [Chamaesiphon sp. OTE_8_metabat_110]